KEQQHPPLPPRTSTPRLDGDCGQLNPIETARRSAKRPVVGCSPVKGTTVSRARGWQVGVARGVDTPIDRSATATGAATEAAGSDAVLRATMVSSGGVR